MHSKLIVVDGIFAYFGSTNHTGAVTRDPETVAQLAGLFDRYWIGDECPDCAFRDRSTLMAASRAIFSYDLESRLSQSIP